MNKLVLLWLELIADRSIESFHATEMLLIPETPNFAVSLTLKTIVVTECDLLPRKSLTKNRQMIKENLSSKLRLAKLQYVINVCAKFEYI